MKNKISSISNSNQNPMKAFLKRLFLFTLILSSYLFINYLVNKTIISFQKSNLKITNLIIAGDSHPQKSINPNLFNSAISISQTAEPYISTFWKLKYLIQDTIVDTLILGFSHHNISAFNDLKFKHKPWNTEMYNRTYITQNFKLLNPELYEINEFYKTYFKNMCIYPNTEHFKFIGGYENFNLNKIEDYNKAIKRHYLINKKPAGISISSIAYLDSIANFCTDNNILLILISSPVHYEYSKRIPKYIVDRYEKEKNRLRQEDIQIWDFTNNKYSDEYFLNSDHLNAKGSLKFTTDLTKLLKQNKTIQ